MIAASKNGTYSLFQTMGLHPVAAFAAVAVDWMLFGGSLATMGIGWAVSIPVGLALGAGVALVQQSERGFNDDWAPAVGKGILVGLLTAIPTALPSVAVAGAGMAGAARMFLDRK